MDIFTDPVPPTPQPPPERRIFTVSELTSKIKSVLENQFDFIWISGEISDFKIPASGHFYFTLKDENARIQAVMFKGQNRHLTFHPEDGMQVVGLGRVSVYALRGIYQIIFELLEPKGVGALQVAFEQLKRRLYKEGLFDPRFKKPVPFFPEKIAVITSPTGAVIHDILNVARRRFENIRVMILPVSVQGEDAATQIVSAIETLNAGGPDGRPLADVAILARGGGSLEDLQAFNSEVVARAIFSSNIPIVSGVGHETDFTIADFVADLRAPTPSAAAEIVVPKKADLLFKLREWDLALIRILRTRVKEKQQRLNETFLRLKDPRRKIVDQRLRLDDATLRLVRTARNRIRMEREKLSWRTQNLCAKSPLAGILKYNETIEKIENNLLNIFELYFSNKKGACQGLSARLTVLGPMNVLNRGYSIARTFPEGRILRDSNQVDTGDGIDLTLAKGSLFCRVERKPDGETNL
ncbi:MAG: exodeoxyribonuclease VII large subunit [Deltaproteobacteria bacterium]|nr:exodeoxyribonuclease VII large subunit [Deltaproteobacteria bacterium]